MNILTIIINNETVFKNIHVGKNINQLSFIWGQDVLEWHKSSLQFRLRSYLFEILQSNSNIKVLDLSKLEGLQEPNYPASHLHEIRFPHSINSVSYYKIPTIRKISAPGAKAITIHEAPNLECIVYGNNLEELSLTETGIVNIDLPENVKLKYEAFRGCKKLESVILRSGTDVPPSAFEDCPNLYEVTLPDDLLVIEPNVFSGCSNLHYIYGAKNVKQIFPSAFEGCFSLKMMECKDFYRFTDLSISDEQWLQKFRPYTPLTDLKASINKFILELKEKDINNPEEYIAENFFRKSESHFGFVLDYQTHIRGWMIWSLSHERFFATKGINCRLKKDDLIEFSLEHKPTVTVEENIYFQFPTKYIDDSSSLKIIERDNEDTDGYVYFIEYFKPRISLLDHYKEIVQTIDNLDITSIIESYSIKERTWWQKYPGRDDSQFYERIARSDYSDLYLDTLLPQEKREEYDNGCMPWGFDEAEETRKLQEAANSEANSIKESARKHYSKEAHICKLLEDILTKRRNLENDIECKYHINSIKNFLQCRYVNSGEGENSLAEFYKYSIDDILRDQKYNSSISWSYKHGWVEETEEL